MVWFEIAVRKRAWSLSADPGPCLLRGDPTKPNDETRNKIPEEENALIISEAFATSTA